MYMYSGMADVAALDRRQDHARAGDAHLGQPGHAASCISPAASAPPAATKASASRYELPNMTAYNETCASVGMDYWNHRLFLLHGDAQVHRRHGAHALQRADLRRLARRQDVLLSEPARVERPARAQEWFGVACCPGNITRFMASVPGYVYATGAATRSTSTSSPAAPPTSISPAASVQDRAGDALSVGRRRQDRR